MVVVDSKRSPKTGNYLEMVGSYNPRQKSLTLKEDRIKHWLSVGAKTSDTVHNILVEKKVIEGKKVNPLGRKTPIIKEKEEAPEEAKAEESGDTENATEAAPAAEEKAEEAPKEAVTEEPKEEAPKEAVKEEAPEEAPQAETDKPATEEPEAEAPTEPETKEEDKKEEAA